MTPGRLHFAVILQAAIAIPLMAADERPPINYDESKVGDLPIPGVLTCSDGSQVTTREQWLEKRRPELLALFEREVYGRTPGGKPAGMRFVQTSENRKALGGKATMRQVSIFFTGQNEPRCDVLLFLPNERKKPVPVFAGLNFAGNQSVTSDPSITMPTGWFREDKEKLYAGNKASEKSRGNRERRWPVEAIVSRGYGLATAYYGDIDPDFDDGFQNGVHPLFFRPGQTQPAEDEWGSIGAWAWGLSRIADYLQTLPEVDPGKLAVVGHSRLGKTSLWAGAQDERFGLVISNNSGAGGAALSKRIFGETCEVLNRAFPHWFCDNFNKYSNNEAALPVDQHQLVALMAPRPVYIASATEDLWADPKGEFLAGKLAEPAYALFGKAGLGVDEPPAPDRSVGGSIGYHARTGKHDILIFDWERYMDFADKHWGKPEKAL